MIFSIGIIIFILEIMLLVLAIKKDKKIYWGILFSFHIILIIFLIGNYIYEDKLPTNDQDIFSGLNDLTLYIITMFLFWINIIMLYVSIIAKIIVFEKKQKSLGKVYKNPLILIVAMIFLGISVFYVFKDIYNNYDNIKGKGKVISIEKVEEDFTDTKGNPVIEWYWSCKIEFEVNGEKFVSEMSHLREEPKFKVGDEIDIVYKKHQHYNKNKGTMKENCYMPTYDINKNYYIPTYIDCNYEIYIPSMLMSLILFLIRFKSSNKEKKEIENIDIKKEKQNNKENINSKG